MHNPTGPDDTFFDPHAQIMTNEELIQLGAGDVAYIRKVDPQMMASLFPNMPPLHDNVSLYALLNADGTPVLLADSYEAAVANAYEHELEMVALH